MDLLNYNKILSINNILKYPYNLNIKDNILETKKEIELEYIKDFKILKKKKNYSNRKGKNELKYIFIY